MGFFDNLKKTVTDALNQSTTQSSNTVKDIVFNDIPTTLEGFKALPYADLKDPFAVAAMCICALCLFPTDQDTSVAMMNTEASPNRNRRTSGRGGRHSCK